MRAANSDTVTLSTVAEAASFVTLSTVAEAASFVTLSTVAEAASFGTLSLSSTPSQQSYAASSRPTV